MAAEKPDPNDFPDAFVESAKAVGEDLQRLNSLDDEQFQGFTRLLETLGYADEAEQLRATRRDILKSGTTVGSVLLGGLLGIGTAEAFSSTERKQDSIGQTRSLPGHTETNAQDANPHSISKTPADRIQVTPDDTLEDKIAVAGRGGTLEFTPGIYRGNVSPMSQQTWIVGTAVEFRPVRNQPVLSLVNLSGVSFIGTLKLADPNSVTSAGVQLCKLDGAQRCSFQRLWIEQPNVGIQTFSTNRNCELNQFGSILIVDAANEYITVNGETNDNQWGSVVCWGAGDGTSGSGTVGVKWDTENKDGGNIFNVLMSIGVGGHGFEIKNLNNEIWASVCVLDSNGGNGLHIDLSNTSNRYLLFGSLFLGGNQGGYSRSTGHGAKIVGSPTHTVKGVFANQVITIGNAGSGWEAEYLQDWAFGLFRAEADGSQLKGLHLINNCADGHIGYIHTTGHSGNGLAVQSGRSHEDISIGNVNVKDGYSVGGVKYIRGHPTQKEDLTVRSGGYSGEFAHHDGTDSINTNDAEIAQWDDDAGKWRGLYSGTIIR